MYDRLPALELPERAAARRDSGADLIPLQGVPTLPMPPHVVDAVVRAAGAVFPRQSRGSEALRSAIADQLATRYGLAVDASTELLITHGAQHGMSVALRALLSPGDEVLIPAPTYFFDAGVRMAGAVPRYVASGAEDGWALPLDRLAAAVTGATKAIIICNPNNPTGNVAGEADLVALLELAKKHDLLVFADESYEDYVHDGPGYRPQQCFRHVHDRLVTVTSFSKNLALTSWRVGYLHAPADLLEAIHHAFEWDAINVGDLSQIAAHAALTGPRDWLEPAFRTFRERRALLLESIAAAGFTAWSPSAGVFCFADFSRTGLSGDELQDALLAVGVPALTGNHFRGSGSFARVLYGGSAESLREVAGRLKLLPRA
ncbi:pyridoxal phosphate-dependent aminotransferase [Amycolatopsis jiangsuensis]|uniref:Aspartate/methionine/tyrosine aminotransferase n=1 Tax=Amycolatopsis jiangsuensis TaxID=1181879 RepID=A0A840IS63_9PSEU|nr:pyridoxal phosphate-dependent aminotransferase [Amycolatopsis jiangsuensis]MBB4684052.1 aspartate/methionine/tyrosine aminotransferase [Amycolatopsis jiangsuensis]